jgi:hypothetical protein
MLGLNVLSDSILQATSYSMFNSMVGDNTNHG